MVVRQRRRGGRPVTEPLSLNYTQLSNLRYSDDRYADLAQARQEFATWRTYYLDPREAMRRALPPREVDDIAANGGNLAPFLYALKNGRTKHFDAVVRAARNLIPAIEGLDVELDRERGELDIRVSQDGTTYSSRVVSEGTLRVLALCAIAATPWPSPLVAFEEPENGVHPRRIELIANLLRATAFAADRQVLITTHSPVLVASILRQQREFPDLDIGVFVCRREGRDTTFKKFASAGPLLDDPEIRAAFREQDDASVLQRLIISGWIDG